MDDPATVVHRDDLTVQIQDIMRALKGDCSTYYWEIKKRVGITDEYKAVDRLPGSETNNIKTYISDADWGGTGEFKLLLFSSDNKRVEEVPAQLVFLRKPIIVETEQKKEEKEAVDEEEEEEEDEEDVDIRNEAVDRKQYPQQPRRYEQQQNQNQEEGNFLKKLSEKMQQDVEAIVSIKQMAGLRSEIMGTVQPPPIPTSGIEEKIIEKVKDLIPKTDNSMLNLFAQIQQQQQEDRRRFEQQQIEERRRVDQQQQEDRRRTEQQQIEERRRLEDIEQRRLREEEKREDALKSFVQTLSTQGEKQTQFQVEMMRSQQQQMLEMMKLQALKPREEKQGLDLEKLIGSPVIATAISAILERLKPPEPRETPVEKILPGLIQAMSTTMLSTMSSVVTEVVNFRENPPIDPLTAKIHLVERIAGTVGPAIAGIISTVTNKDATEQQPTTNTQQAAQNTQQLPAPATNAQVAVREQQEIAIQEQKSFGKRVEEAFEFLRAHSINEHGVAASIDTKQVADAMESAYPDVVAGMRPLPMQQINAFIVSRVSDPGIQRNMTAVIELIKKA